MNPTPERALELANILTGPMVAERSEEDEAAAILCAYADLYRKWQAVLDAEPVAEVCVNYSDDDRYKHAIDYNSTKVDSIAIGAQLIIKPTA